MRLYIAVLDEVPDYIVPTLVSHSVLGAHLFFTDNYRTDYLVWLETSFKKCVIKVNRKEFNKISEIPFTYLGHENTTLEGKKSCAIPLPVHNEDIPNVLKFAKLWKPAC
jgi:hypothetical protein